MMNRQPVTDDSPANTSPEVAVVGAGISGLACASGLLRHGIDCLLFDRGRNPGGRLASRTRDLDAETSVTVDHGAPLFELDEEAFRPTLEDWTRRGLVSPWRPACARWSAGRLVSMPTPEDHHVGVPTQAALPRALSERFSVEQSVTVDGLRSTPEGLTLETTPRGAEPITRGPCRVVVLATAPVQARRLLDPDTTMARSLQRIRMAPTWVTMLHARDPIEALPDILHVDDHPVITKLIRENAKPGRTSTGSGGPWMVHATQEWSEPRYEHDRNEIATELHRAAEDLVGAINGAPIRFDGTEPAHRWGLARAVETIEERALVDGARGLVACGDGFGGSGVASCWLSGLAAAEEARTLLSRD